MSLQITQTNWHNSFAFVAINQPLMANDKTQHTPGAPDAAGNEVQGRTHNSQNPAFEKGEARNDISSVDQQEGAMNNGESGATLTPNEKTNSMENKEEKLQEQEAPLKNTDQAFVQVGHNGEPVVPETEEESSRETKSQKPAAPEKQ